MKKENKTFEITLLNGSKCNVTFYCKWSGDRILTTDKGEDFYYRVDHFEFRDNHFISHTGYKSHFLNFDNDEVYDPVEAATELGNAFANLERKEKQQLTLL